MIKDIFKNKYEIILRDNYMHIKYYSSIIDINYNLIRIGLDSNILIINGNPISSHNRFFLPNPSSNYDSLGKFQIL